MLSRDPNKSASLTVEQRIAISKLGLFPVHIICDDPSRTDDDRDCVAFFAACGCVPRVDERLKLEDGKSFKVTSVHHVVTTDQGDSNMPSIVFLTPNVRTVLCVPSDASHSE